MVEKSHLLVGVDNDESGHAAESRTGKTHENSIDVWPDK